MRAERRGPLRSRNFRLFFAGYSTSLFGTGMAAVGVSFAVIRGGGTATDLGLVLTGQVIANIVCVLAGGVLADRIGQRVVMLASDAVRTVSQGAFAALVLLGHPPIAWLVALYAVQGGATGFFEPALIALTPKLVDAEDLHDANVLTGLSVNVGRIGGPAVAGGLIAITNPGVVLALDAATYAVSVFSLSSLDLGAIELSPPESFLSQLRAGWTAWRSRTWLWVVSLKFAFSNMLVLAPFLVLGPIQAGHHLGGAGAWGLILAAQGIGAVIGGLALRGRRPSRPLPLAIIVQAGWVFPIIGVALLLPAPAVAAGALLAGIGSAVFNVIWNTVLQSNIPPHLIARATSYDYLASFSLGPLGLAIAGPEASALGASTVLWIAAAWQILSTVATLAVPDIRNLRDRPTPTVTTETPNTESIPTDPTAV